MLLHYFLNTNLIVNSDDNQAVDRAYRIGQVRDVIVYRLITCGTIEEHTYRRQARCSFLNLLFHVMFVCTRKLSFLFFHVI